MQFLYKIPGYILLLFGGFCLSWGGFIIRSFEEATVWQILLLRSVFFMIALMFFLTATYKKNTIKIIKDRDLKYQVNVIATMLGRARKHPHKTKNMHEAIKVSSLWMKNYKKNRMTKF